LSLPWWSGVRGAHPHLYPLPSRERNGERSPHVKAKGWREELSRRGRGTERGALPSRQRDGESSPHVKAKERKEEPCHRGKGMERAALTSRQRDGESSPHVEAKGWREELSRRGKGMERGALPSKGQDREGGTLPSREKKESVKPTSHQGREVLSPLRERGSSLYPLSSPPVRVTSLRSLSPPRERVRVRGQSSLPWRERVRVRGRRQQRNMCHRSTSRAHAL